MNPALILPAFYGTIAAVVAIIVLIVKHFQKQTDAWNEGYQARGPLNTHANSKYKNEYKQKYRARAYDGGFNYRQKQHDKQEAINMRNLDRAIKKGIIK